MIPYSQDITIRFGDVKQVFFRLRDKLWDNTTQTFIPGDYHDLTDCTVLSQVRIIEDSDEVLLTFTPIIGDQTDINLKGSVMLKVTPVQTAGVTRSILAGVWDVQITEANDDVNTWIAGKVTFVKDVSRV